MNQTALAETSLVNDLAPIKLTSSLRFRISLAVAAVMLLSFFVVSLLLSWQTFNAEIANHKLFVEIYCDAGFLDVRPNENRIPGMKK